MKETINDFVKEIAYHVKAYILLSIAAFKLKLAMNLADIKQKAHNRRFFVVLITTGITNTGRRIEKLRSIDNRGFKYCKRMKWLPKRMTTLDLEQKSFYATPLKRNNSLVRQEREKALKKYLRYQRVMNELKL
jgi:hypothetical protein